MTAWDERARAEAENELVRRAETMWRTEGEHLIYSWVKGFERGFTEGAAWQREHLLTDEIIERAARVLNKAGWTCMDGWHGHYDDCPYCRGTCLALARAALTEAIGDE